MTTTIQSDSEYAAAEFWCSLDEVMPAVAGALRTAETVTVSDAVWQAIQQIDGFRGGPAYAPTALISVE